MPKEVLEIMHRATDDLSNSCILDRTVKVDQKAPDFTLEKTQNQEVNLYTLLAKRPVVLSWYRGNCWPYCSLDLEALGNAATRFEEQGAVLLTVSPQVIRYNKAMQEEKNWLSMS